MSARHYLLLLVCAGTFLAGLASRPACAEAEVADVYPVAIFSFNERGSGVKGYGAKVSDILFGELVANPDLYLVDRAEIKKVLDEYELKLSGMVNPAQAPQIGKLTGAKIIVTGSVIEADRTLYLVAKIIGTETSKMKGARIKGKTSDELGTLVEQLAEKVGETITGNAKDLVAKQVKMSDRIAALKEKLGDAARPSLFVKVEERHVGRATIDPAAETEITLFARETGFEVVDAKKGSEKTADVVIHGEGFSEFATRRGNLISVKARLEVKAIDGQTDKVIAIDRQTEVVIDVTEQVAGKSALQKAAAAIAERLLPKVVEKK